MAKGDFWTCKILFLTQTSYVKLRFLKILYFMFFFLKQFSIWDPMSILDFTHKWKKCIHLHKVKSVCLSDFSLLQPFHVL